jgi:hypothetical protein
MKNASIGYSDKCVKGWLSQHADQINVIKNTCPRINKRLQQDAMQVSAANTSLITLIENQCAVSDGSKRDEK